MSPWPVFAPFDVADYLDSEETIAARLSAALDDDNPDLFLVAIKKIAPAFAASIPRKIPASDWQLERDPTNLAHPLVFGSVYWSTKKWTGDERKVILAPASARGERTMPLISSFYGILIYMYWLDTKQHNLPHIHAEYAGSEAVFSIAES